MRILIAGVTGMLGRAVWREAVAGPHAVAAYMGRLENTPDPIVGHVLINCAGLVKQRSATIADQVHVNSYGPHKLAEAAALASARLIHISTDCVFQGGGPHAESDIPDADDFYAISKRAGEVAYGPHLTLRTSFVGFGKRGLLHDLRHQPSVTTSHSLLWSGHTVDTIARLIMWLVDHPHVTGLLHVPGTFQTRYTLARDLKARWNLPARIDRDDGFTADRRLISGKWDYYRLPKLPDFEQQLITMRGPEGA